MTTDGLWNGLRLAAAIALLALGAPSLAAAQPPAAAPSARTGPGTPVRPGPRPGEVETDPIRCWWRTDTAEVRVGQRFGLTLTCGVIETRSLKVVANTNTLDPGAIQLTPFEVAGGTRREDILSPPWRYFQYDYQVRLLSEGFFGQDLMLPSVPITYNVQAAAGDGAQGRDLTYALPPLPLRVASIVPRAAGDIRDEPTEGFAAIERRRARASTAMVAGGVLVACAAVCALLAVAGAFGKVRRRRPVRTARVSPFTAIGGALRALADVQAEVRTAGWSAAHARRAMAAARVAAAVALDRPFAQGDKLPDAPLREGQIIVRQGLRRRPRVISAATTAATIDRELAERPTSLKRVRGALDGLRSALYTFSTAGYGRADTLDAGALDRAADETREALRALRWRRLVPLGAQPPRDAPLTSLATPTTDRA